MIYYPVNNWLSRSNWKPSLLFSEWPTLAWRPQCMTHLLPSLYSRLSWNMIERPHRCATKVKMTSSVHYWDPFQDPFVLRQMNLLSMPNMFPNSKYVLMLRDPRAIANSLQTRNIKITGVDNDSLESIFSNWNRNMRFMLGQCQRNEWERAANDLDFNL
jgi:hypothetical protein